MDINYPDWLREAVPTEATFRTKLSELRRVESVYGDLDDLFDSDELTSLIEELTYSSEDTRNRRPNPSKLEISGDIRNNLASYKSAVTKYQRFRQDVEREAARPAAQRVEARNAEANGFEQRTLSLEADLQSALRSNISQLEPGLEIADGGSEKKIPSGFIDILARDQSGQHVVIELKAVVARRETLGQIAAYMADIEDEMAHRPRGILIAPDFDPKLTSGARMISGLSLVKYSFTFRFDQVHG